MFVPVRIGVGAGGGQTAAYDRSIELTSRQMVAFEREAGDMSEPLHEIGASLRANVAGQFATQGAMVGGGWTVLSEPYGSWKAQHAPGVPILVGLRRTGPKGSRPQSYAPSGAMRRELLDPLSTHVSPRRLLWAPVSDIAGYHLTGTPNMPARPPLDLTLAFLHGVDRTFVRWLGRVMDRLGLAGPGSG